MYCPKIASEILDADYLRFSMLCPFAIPYCPAGTTKPQTAPPQRLGLLLTRPTAALLANASPPAGDTPWKAELEDRVVYIDVPHGAVTIGESLQLRALFARRQQNDRIMIIGLVADRGSERAHGRMFALLERDGCVRLWCQRAHDEAVRTGLPEAALTDFPQIPGSIALLHGECHRTARLSRRGRR